MFRKTVVFCVLILLSASVQSCSLIRELFNSHWELSSHWNRIEFLHVPSPDSTLTLENEPAWYEAKYKGYDAVYLERRFTEEHVGDLTGFDYFEIQKLRYIVLNPEADWATTFRLNVDDEDQNLDSVYMTITSPDGMTSHFDKGDLYVEQTGDGNTIYKFAYPDVRKGSMIEEGYILRTASSKKRPAVRDHFFTLQSSVPTENVVYKYIYPPSWKLRIKNGSTGAPPVEKSYDRESNGRTLKVQARDQAAWKEEAWSPYQLEVIPYVEFSLVDAVNAFSRVRVPGTWSRMLYGIRGGDHGIMCRNPKLEEITKSATEHADGEIEKISAITRWVQQNIKPGDCHKCDYRDVIEKGEGGIFFILEITMAMLCQADVDTRMILIHPANEGHFDREYVTFGEFVTPGVAAITESDTLVIYPFIKDLPAGLLPPAWQERPSIYISADHETIIGTSPRGAVDENTEEEEYDLTIDEDGLISVREKKFFRGISAYLMRSALREAKESEMEDFMSELLTYEEGNVELGEYTIENLDDYRQPLEITLNYTIDNLVTVTPEEVIFQTGGLFSPSSERKIKIETDERVNPIRIYADEEVIKRITINHPPEWKLETKLKPVEFNNQFGELNATYTSESGRFTAEQRRLLKKSSEPKEKIDDLMLITSRRSQLSIPTLIFAVTGK